VIIELGLCEDQSRQINRLAAGQGFGEVQPRELQAGALTSANRRYANYRKFVDEQLGKDDLNGEEDDGEPGRSDA
jgi:hypothetical protein